MEILRQTMIKTKISDIVNGKFVKKEGMEPSYVLTGMGQKISRANILGILVDKFVSEDSNFSTITIDDDTDSVRVKVFKDNINMFDKLEIGDLVMVIGKVREYMDENYIIPEVAKKIANPNYESLHKLEILKQLTGQKKLVNSIKKEEEKFESKEDFKKHVKEKYNDKAEGVIETIEEETIEKDNKPVVLEKLDELDKGKGVEFKKLLEASGLPENKFEEVINELLSDGICYEPSPGVIRKV